MNVLVESGDESLLRWTMSIEEDDSSMIEEDTDGLLLRTVVRTNYLTRLRRSLRNNLETMKQKKDSGIEKSNINKVVKGCGALLEEKALRNCMVTKLYQRMMIQTIKEVDKSTTEGYLYLPLKGFSENQNKIVPPQNKEVQTELNMEFFNSLLFDMQHINEPRGNVRQRFDNSVPARTQMCGKAFNGVSKCEKLVNNFVPTQTDIQDKNDIPDLNGIIESFGARNKSKKISTISGDPGHAPASDKSTDFEMKLHNPTFCEAVSCWYNLEYKIDDMPPAKRKNLDETFTRLFGYDHAVDYFGLTTEQKSLTCRKRIAKYVVIELTNYYSKQKIASKILFKTMAKHITSLLLGRSLYPAPEEIKKCVDEFFINGRMVQTEDDFFI